MPAAAVLYVKDLTVMKAFFQACFGMTTVESGGADFCVLASDAWELSLVSVPAAIAATLVISDPPERRAETPIKLAFDVPDIEGLRPVITASGGQPDTIGSGWDSRGLRHLDFLDPEGNVLQLRQRLPATLPPAGP